MWGELYMYTAFHIAAEEGQVDVIKEWVALLRTREEELTLKTTEDFIACGGGLYPDVSEEVLMERAMDMVRQYERKLSIILEMQRTTMHRTPLYLAVKAGHVNLVKELASHMRPEGFEVRRNKGDPTVLQKATSKGNVDIVRELVSRMKQESLELQDGKGSTALHMAVEKGDIAIVKELVHSMRQESLELQDKKGFTALHMAVANGDIAIVKELAPKMRKEGLEIKTDDGNNPLHLALMLGNMNIAEELMPLMKVYALTHTNGEGYTALARVFSHFNVSKEADVMEIAKYMAENNRILLLEPMLPTNEIPVVRATRLGKWELARHLYSVTPLDVLGGSHGSSFICYCLNSSKGVDLAWHLLQRCPKLAFTTHSTYDEGTPIMKLAEVHFAFLSGTRLTWWQMWLYHCIHIPEVDHTSIYIDVAESKDDHSNKKNFSSSVRSLYRRFSERLYIFCGMQHIYEMKSTHRWIFQILHLMGEEIRKGSLTPNEQATVQKSILKAIELGHFEFVTQLCKVHPDLLLDTYGEENRSIFHFAIENRLEEVYNLIYGLEVEKQHNITLRVVDHGNTMLHVAAKLSLIPQFDRIQDASLQMQSELQWFKAVERVVPLEMHERRNTSDGSTARELFTKTHKKLLDDAEDATKKTAASCTVVGALIVTMMFAAAFTVPGGNDGNTGLPLMLNRRLFKVFIVSDTISLGSSTTSVITFLGILTSRFAEDDFHKSLPTKMMMGLFTLFLSIASMIIAFSCALVLMLNGEARIVIPCILFASFPAIMFVGLLFPHLGKIYISTYGTGRFAVKTKKVTL